jgi:predicted site-specific integrase-resolvase
MQLLNEKDASKMLGMSVSSLRRWRTLGSGPRFIRMNGVIRYDISDLQRFIYECARVSTKETAA